MHVARLPWGSANGKVHTSIYLRESYRQGSQVRRQHIANLTDCPPEEIAAIELALKHKENLAVLGLPGSVSLTEGPLVGAARWLF